MGHTPGRIFAVNGQNGVVAARIFNFDIAKDQLKKEHMDWLKSEVVGRLKSGGSINIVGLASRSGSDAFNMALSRRRADSVIQFLRKESANNFNIALDIAVGERAAALAGVHDGAEDEHWRAVVLSVWNRPDPPPKPIIPPSPPPLVERRSFVKFLAEQHISGGTGDDPQSATLFNNWAMNKAQDMWGGNNFMQEVNRKVPPTYKVVEILVLRDTSGSVYIAGADVSIVAAQVAYKWGVRTKPCLLINGFGRDGVWKNTDPSVSPLTDDQADMWVASPFRALKSVRDWKLTYLPYDDYIKGKL